MATVTVFDSIRMQAIEDGTVVDGNVDGSGDLVLIKHDGSTIDAGHVKGDKGDPGDDGISPTFAISYRVASAAPSTYPAGVTNFSLSAGLADGWPTNLGVVTTSRVGTLRTWQTVMDKPSGTVWNRSEDTGDIWGSWQLVASSAIGTVPSNSLPVFSTSSARDIAIPSPTDGQSCYIQQTDRIETYITTINGHVTHSGWFPMSGCIPTAILIGSSSCTFGTTLADPLWDSTEILDNITLDVSGGIAITQDGLYSFSGFAQLTASGSSTVDGIVRIIHTRSGTVTTVAQSSGNTPNNATGLWLSVEGTKACLSGDIINFQVQRTTSSTASRPRRFTANYMRPA